ncbi:putative cyclic di-GMP phosphodiesterase PdeN [Paraburkholderia caffeinitolerans]|uniref:cyclic-guanylate-specific phosphodiesterase n=1 Tax=Paraburkholderia caffeinitolerans TaxID=1723730 RepID=A0A6J5GLG1_9BURK|nr:putative cyclic di-GMP phosphodiesterase PdeN [Paraburkholderia caffeinitolerans]
MPEFDSRVSHKQQSGAASAWARAARVAMMALAAALPVLLCAAFTRYEAERLVRNEAELASNFVVNQVVAIAERARNTARVVAPRAAQPCTELAAALTYGTATEPYIRTLNVVDGDRLVCSSALGKQMPVMHSIAVDGRLPRGDWLAIVPRTPMVADRAALLVGVRAPGARAVIAVVDSQYLLDLLHAAAPLSAYRQAELRVGTGTSLLEASDDTSLASSPLVADTRKLFAGSVINLQLHGEPAHLNEIWGSLLLRYMPWVVVFSALLAWLVHRVQRSRQSRREQLLRAIRGGEFHVEYQPLYGVESGRCEGAEALLRWVRPGIGTVRPDEFIQAAEEDGVIVPLTQHLLKLIARDVMLWGTRPGFHLGINFAPEHLSGEDLLSDVRRFLAQIAGRQIQTVMEITERSIMRNTGQARSNLEALRAEGVQVAIDDFGTGYCALSYLEKFPFDILKIDRGFVLTIDAEGRSAVVLDTIVSLAHSLGARIVAEGVASQEQFEYLRARGAHYVQGFLYAKPMRADVFSRWYGKAGSETCANPQAHA